MLRNRLILCLLMRDDLFVNSRQFVLNPVGNLETILQYLHFEAIDELVVLNVSRSAKDIRRFAGHLATLGRYCFIPIAAGGGVRSVSDCRALLEAGADKIVMNTAFHETPDLVREAIRLYGRQCIVLSIDVRTRRSDGKQTVFTKDGRVDTDRDPVDMARAAEELGVGEIFLTSIDRDGTCVGYDTDLIRRVAEAVNIPVVASGGVGNFDHLVDGVRAGASAVSAANIFHFIGHSLIKAKKHVRENGLNFPDPLWHFSRDVSL